MPKIQEKDKETLAKIFRNVIYGQETSDKNWESAKSFYLADIQKFLDEINKKGYDLVSVSNKKSN